MLEITRLVLGLLIALVHKPLADFITEQDAQLVALFRQRGVTLPASLGRDTSRNLFFAMGILVAAIQLVRLYLLIHP